MHVGIIQSTEALDWKKQEEKDKSLPLFILENPLFFCFWFGEPLDQDKDLYYWLLWFPHVEVCTETVLVTFPGLQLADGTWSFHDSVIM